jgi:hypothetical protein
VFPAFFSPDNLIGSATLSFRISKQAYSFFFGKIHDSPHLLFMPMEGKAISLGNYVIGGVAYGGRYGISKVQVSMDGGQNWQDADMKKPLSKWAWVLWSYQ